MFDFIRSRLPLLVRPSSGESADARYAGCSTRPKVEANVEVSDSKIKASNPLTYALEARQPVIEKVTKLNIVHAVRLYEATNGAFPKDHDEFMTGIIKANNIHLPQLGGGWKYQYDVEKHELVVVRDKEPAAAGN